MTRELVGLPGRKRPPGALLRLATVEGLRLAADEPDEGLDHTRALCAEMRIGDLDE